MKKTTLVIGASSKPERYSNMAIKMLLSHGHPVWAIGKKEAMTHGIHISPNLLPLDNIDTVTLYLSSQNQHPYYNYLLDLKPRRIIFNPGTENPDWKKIAQYAGIQCIEGCTLVLLQTGQY